MGRPSALVGTGKQVRVTAAGEPHSGAPGTKVRSSADRAFQRFCGLSLQVFRKTRPGSTVSEWEEGVVNHDLHRLQQGD